MITTDRKVRKLMQEYQKRHNISSSVIRADMDRKTARKYIRAGKLPSQMRVERTWRTRPDPFMEHWAEAAEMLEMTPELEGKILFEWLCERHPGKYQEGQLRSFQRRVRDWRALHGPDKEVFFPQVHERGKRMTTDFTRMNSLGITINGEKFDHLLCHCVLTYSNWEWATICHSESMLAIRSGVQESLFRLGRVPREHWTDHSSAATHEPGKAADTEKRVFNREYSNLMEHFGMCPMTIQVDAPHENGDVESLHGVLKRRIEQYLLLRGSRDFGSVKEYQTFLEWVLEKANTRRVRRLEEEMGRMRQLNVSRLSLYKSYCCTVHSSSTITADRSIYSVPSRLRGEKVDVKRYEDHIEVFYKNTLQLKASVAHNRRHCINYRHLIGWLVRKPGAFSNYRFREDLFPSDIFRWAWEQLSEAVSERTATREFLQILHHAAFTMQSDVENALRELKNSRQVPRLDKVLELCKPEEPQLPELRPLPVDLKNYNKLLCHEEVPA
ncbi:MAG: IS21 family transposase [Thermodesulfobacteriota bacterium]|nr:IS21 family transposase [Thermodesulfobacteriota bacterium]